MAEFSKQDIVEGTEVKMNRDNYTYQEEKLQGKHDFFVLDMESLSLSNNNNSRELDPFSMDSRAPVTLKLQKSLSRKGSHGAQRKIINGANNFPSQGVQSPTTLVPATSKPLILVSSMVADRSAGTPETTELLPSCRRRREPAAPWLNPRKVLLFFATVSCMGTIILLYFTLAMNQMDGRDADAKMILRRGGRWI